MNARGAAPGLQKAKPSIDSSSITAYSDISGCGRVRDHPGLTCSVWRILHAQWRVLHIGTLAEHLKLGTCTTRKLTPLPVRHRRWLALRSRGVIQPNATYRSKSFSAASVTPISTKSATSGAA